MGSHSGVLVELERPAQIGRPDACCRHAGADVDKWDPTGARGKVVAQLWSQTHEPLTGGRELRSCEQFQSKFEIAPIPMALAPRMTEHVAVGEVDESQIMSFAAAEHRDAISGSGAQADRLRGRSESFTHAIFPDAFSLRFKIGLPHRYGVCERWSLLPLSLHHGCRRNPQGGEAPKNPIAGLPGSHNPSSKKARFHKEVANRFLKASAFAGKLHR